MLTVRAVWRFAIIVAVASASGCSEKSAQTPAGVSAGAGSPAPIAGTTGTIPMESAGIGGAGAPSVPPASGTGGLGSAAGSESMEPARPDPKPMAGMSGSAASPAAGSGSGGSGGSGGASGSAAGGGSMAEPPKEVTCPATSELEPGDHMGTIQVGSYTRNYLVHVPASYTGKTAVPLVTDWHGLLTNSDFQRTLSGYREKSDREGFIVVFPNAIEGAWNVGHCCTSSKDIDDVAFARALIEKLKGQACIDPSRVYAVGYSLGGGMSMKLACDATELFAAIAPAAFDLMVEEQWPCKPSRPIPIIQFRGTNDFIVPYEGGDTMPPNGLQIIVTFLGAEANFMKWSMLNGCTGSPVAGSNGCQTYNQCASGTEVTLCTARGGSHDFGDPDVAWETLKKYKLP